MNSSVGIVLFNHACWLSVEDCLIGCKKKGLLAVMKKEAHIANINEA